MNIYPRDNVTNRVALATIDASLANDVQNSFLDLLFSVAPPGINRLRIESTLNIDVAETRDTGGLLVIEAGDLLDELYWREWSGDRVGALVFAEDAGVAAGLELLSRHSPEENR